MQQGFTTARFSLGLLLLTATVLCGCQYGEELVQLDRQTHAQGYQQLRSSISATRHALTAQLKRRHSRAAKHSALNQARAAMENRFIPQLFRYWYGTRWDYNGTTTAPRQGQIACGYFVTTVLQHSGFKLNRVRLAQMASENMIKRLVDSAHIRRYRALPLTQFLADVKQWGDGIYLVGLDNHTGFIVNRNGKIRFVHASYFPPFAVVNEAADSSIILARSKYRVLGKLLQSHNLRRWLADG